MVTDHLGLQSPISEIPHHGCQPSYMIVFGQWFMRGVKLRRERVRPPLSQSACQVPTHCCIVHHSDSKHTIHEGTRHFDVLSVLVWDVRSRYILHDDVAELSLRRRPISKSPLPS